MAYYGPIDGLIREELRENVQAGVEFLDGEKPEWVSKINLKYLDMGSWTSCVYGQVFGGEEMEDEETAVAYGFMPPHPVCGDSMAWHYLQEMWEAHIAERRS